MIFLESQISYSRSSSGYVARKPSFSALFSTAIALFFAKCMTKSFFAPVSFAQETEMPTSECRHAGGFSWSVSLSASAAS